jgi:hypothetical protein
VQNLSVNFVGFPRSHFKLTLQRTLADFAEELKMVVATTAGIAMEAIQSIRCNGVDLSDRFEVSRLKDGDIITVALIQGAVPKESVTPVKQTRAKKARKEEINE